MNLRSTEQIALYSATNFETEKSLGFKIGLFTRAICSSASLLSASSSFFFLCRDTWSRSCNYIIAICWICDPVYTMPVRNESGMKVFLFPNLLSRLHDAGTKLTLFEWVNQNEWIKTKFKWMNQTFRGLQAVLNRTVFRSINHSLFKHDRIFSKLH